jgi:hypothetical protein
MKGEFDFHQVQILVQYHWGLYCIITCQYLHVLSLLFFKFCSFFLNLNPLENCFTGICNLKIYLRQVEHKQIKLHVLKSK